MNKREQRREDIEAYLECFALKENLKYESYSSFAINDIYWNIIDNEIKPCLKKTSSADRYKIISVTEYAVLAHKPFPEDTYLKNARFAYYIGLNILTEWIISIYPTVDLNNIKNISDFKKGHIKFLRMILNTKNTPYWSDDFKLLNIPKGCLISMLINATTWERAEKQIINQI